MRTQICGLCCNKHYIISVRSTGTNTGILMSLNLPVYVQRSGQPDYNIPIMPVAVIIGLGHNLYSLIYSIATKLNNG